MPHVVIEAFRTNQQDRFIVSVHLGLIELIQGRRKRHD